MTGLWNKPVGLPGVERPAGVAWAEGQSPSSR